MVIKEELSPLSAGLHQETNEYWSLGRCRSVLQMYFWPAFLKNSEQPQMISGIANSFNVYDNTLKVWLCNRLPDIVINVEETISKNTEKI